MKQTNIDTKNYTNEFKYRIIYLKTCVHFSSILYIDKCGGGLSSIDYWHWLGGHDRWYDWSLVATTGRTINHDCSYLSSSPIVRNRTLARTTNICERLQMEIVWSITVWSCNQSEQLVTGRTTDRATAWHQNHERLVVRPRTNGGAITRDWWYDHVRHICVLWSQTDRREFRLILLVRSSTITHNHYDQWHVLSTIWKRFLNFSIVTWSQVWCDCGNRKHEKNYKFGTENES